MKNRPTAIETFLKSIDRTRYEDLYRSLKIVNERGGSDGFKARLTYKRTKKYLALLDSLEEMRDTVLDREYWEQELIAHVGLLSSFDDYCHDPEIITHVAELQELRDAIKREEECARCRERSESLNWHLGAATVLLLPSEPK